MLCINTLVNMIFVTSKLFSVSNIIFTLNSKMQLKCFYHPSLFFVTGMFNIANSANYFFNVRIQKHTHKYCIVHWKCRLGASKSLLLLKLTCFLGTGSQTVQADSCTEMFRHEPSLCIRVTVLSVVSQALPCKHQKCFLFCSVKCVTSLCHSLVSVLLPLCLESV
jgi:hypothetical protein